MNKFSIKEAIKYGWDNFKSHARLLLLVAITIFAVNYIPEGFIKITGQEEGMLVSIIDVASWILGFIISMGFIRITLNIYDKKNVTYSNLFLYNPEYLWRYIVTSLIEMTIIMLGLILLIIPGIIFATRLQFATYFVIDKKYRPIEAIKASWNLTEGQTWNLFLYGLVAILINLAGLLALLVGILVTIPLTCLATTYIYRKLEKN